MRNMNERKMEQDSGRPEQGEINKISIEELARRLETGQISHAEINAKAKMKCAMYLKKWGREPEYIADKLKVCKRTLIRYADKVQAEVLASLGKNHQKKLQIDFVANSMEQSRRLIELTHSRNVGPLAIAKIICLHQQYHLNLIQALQGFGALEEQEPVANPLSDNLSAEKSIVKRCAKRTISFVEEWNRWENFKGSEEERIQWLNKILSKVVVVGNATLKDIEQFTEIVNKKTKQQEAEAKN